MLGVAGKLLNGFGALATRADPHPYLQQPRVALAPGERRSLGERRERERDRQQKKHPALHGDSLEDSTAIFNFQIFNL